MYHNEDHKYAVVSILLGYLHSSSHVRDKLPNSVQGHRLDNFGVVQKKAQKFSQKEQRYIVFYHDDVKYSDGKSVNLYAVPQWFK